MTIARRIWKWTAAIVAVVVVLLAFLIGGLRVWLENSPNLARDIVSRVEAATGLHLSFDRLEARLGWYGPELVFRNARILGTKGGPTLVSARAGHVGFDVWRAISSGRLASARVQLDGAVVHLLLQPTGVALLGQEALARGETDSTPLTIANLPVGRVRLDDGIIIVEDERQRRRGLSIAHVRLDLDRRPSALKFGLQLKLPAELGTRLEMSGAVDGNGEPGTALHWTSTIDGRGLKFAGLSALLTDVVRLPVAGGGNVHAAFGGTDLVLAHADGTFDLRELVLPGEGGTRSAPTTLAGSLSVDRAEQPAADGHRASQWRVRARDIGLASGKERLRGGRAEAEWLLDDGAVQRFKLKVPELPLALLGPFTALATAATVREAGAALAPRGRVTAVDLTATRQAGGATWTIDGKADFRGLGIGAWRAVPGFTGLDGEIAAHGAAGTIKLRAAPLALDLARYLRAPVTATRVAATVRWSQEADGWHLASDDAEADTPDAHGGGLVRLWVPGGGEPPHLVLDLAIHDVELRGAVKYLPLMRFPVDAVSWLDQAFQAGRIGNARLQYVGPTEGFPFREHQGLWLVQGDFSGARVHFATGWADVEDASGELEFRNEGFRAELRSARMGGLTVGGGRAVMTDFRDADLLINGSATGDLHRALRLLQTSPLAKSLGSYFAAVDGRGGFAGQVRLDLPLRHFGDRRVEVDTHLDRAAVRLPGLIDEVTDLSGALHFSNLDFSSPGIRATVLGGPLNLRVDSKVPAKGVDGLHTAVLHLDGNASAERLMAQLDITEGTWLAGSTDWHAEVRLGRLEWMKPLPPKPPEPDLWQLREAEAGRPYVIKPDSHPPPPRREPESRWLPVAVHVESTLAGLALHFPAPLAKAADTARQLKADLLLDPGVREADEAPPRSLGSAEGPHEPHLSVQGSLGNDAFSGEWLKAPAADAGDAGGRLKLARGAARFGGGAPHLREAEGVWLEGRLPRFDLSAWLRVRTSDKPGSPLSAWLKGGELTVDSFGILGFNLTDLRGEFRAGTDAWNVHGSGPAAAGRVRVPFDLHGTQPLELDLERLVLNDRDPEVRADGPREGPAGLPAITAHVGNLEFMKRRLGTVDASLSRIDGGLKLDRATLKAPSFSGQATGRWTGEGDNEWCEIEGSVHSTDVRETLVALAFEPTMAGTSADARGQLRWKDGLDATILERLWGKAHVQAKDGQILTVQPGAGRVLGLLSIATLPRRLALDFHDLTDKGFAFDSLQGDFDFRDGNAYTNNVVVKGPAADIGLVGRTGFKAQDYDQTAVVTGHFGDGLAAAGAIAGGPVIGGALFLFTKVFQGAVEGIARGYYRITGTWDKPRIDSIGSSEAHSAEAGSGALDQGEPAPMPPAPTPPEPAAAPEATEPPRGRR